MLRVDSHQIDLNLLNKTDQELLLNACFAAAHLQLSSAATAMREQLEPLGWYVYEGNHHIAVGKKGTEPDASLKLFDIEDAYLAMDGFPEYLCKERRALGLSLSGTGT